jgi:hypothetical protein
MNASILLTSGLWAASYTICIIDNIHSQIAVSFRCTDRLNKLNYSFQKYNIRYSEYLVKSISKRFNNETTCKISFIEAGKLQ